MGEKSEHRRGTAMNLWDQVRHGIQHPDRVYPYLRRWARDARLRLMRRDHVSYYRAVMAHDSAASPDSAVGSATRNRWLRLGKMQFDYLVKHGLTPQDQVLEIGCGNLRAGWRLISYLDNDHYHGIDISPDILLSAQRTVCEYGLQHKLPRLTLVEDLQLDFLPENHFTVVHAHSVFSHCPIDVIDECLSNIGRILKPGGFFDFTFNLARDHEHHILREDYFYYAESLIELGAKYSLQGQFMDDWEKLPHRQSKIRLVKEPDQEPAKQ